MGHETSQLLRDWSEGSVDAGGMALDRLYPQLRRLAARALAVRQISMSVSDLLQETALRLVRQKSASWRNRAHFFAVASRLMRRALMDEVRRWRRAKRGRGLARCGLETIPLSAQPPVPEVLALDRALQKLTEVDPLATRVVEMRYFAGLTLDETAAALEIGSATVTRRWRFARAWLHAELTPAGVP